MVANTFRLSESWDFGLVAVYETLSRGFVSRLLSDTQLFETLNKKW